MPYYILSAFLFALLQLPYGWVARKKHQAKVFLWLAIAVAVVVSIGTIWFMSANMGKNIALHPFDFTGWQVVGVAAGMMILLTGIMWLVKKKIWPHAIFFFLNVGFLVVWSLTYFWYSGRH